MRIKPFVTGILESAFYDHHPRARGDSLAVRRWMQNYFVFISPEPDCAAAHDVDWLIERAEAAVIRHGVKVLLIDPWNEINMLAATGNHCRNMQTGLCET
jgi:twinkle protein